MEDPHKIHTNWFAGCDGGSPGGPFVDCDVLVEELEINETNFICYPNPFGDKTNIVFYNKEAEHVNITIFDQRGNVIRQLTDKTLSKGKHLIEFDATGLNSGVYFCRFISNSFTSTKMLNVVR